MLIEICHSKKGDQIVMAKFCHTMGGKYKEAKKKHLLQGVMFSEICVDRLSYT